MKVVVCMVGSSPGEGRYTWFKVFAVRGSDLPGAVERAEAWGREKAGGTDVVWTEQAEVEP